jgi:hypothetical protein
LEEGAVCDEGSKYHNPSAEVKIEGSFQRKEAIS